ncbi:hypothetical protein ACFWUU_40275 [Kribbella sp. NPDC058693]|uniref:hypothetical protein n=1 Tax=Kribbella sp. NPDC058693 TaxID=3346602 RepID=UPI003666D939
MPNREQLEQFLAETNLTLDQIARAYAALDVWNANPGGSSFPPPTAVELVRMHAALEAPDTAAALVEMCGPPDPTLSSPEQDANNRDLLAGIRQALGVD